MLTPLVVLWIWSCVVQVVAWYFVYPLMLIPAFVCGVPLLHYIRERDKQAVEVFIPNSEVRDIGHVFTEYEELLKKKLKN